MRLAPGTRLGPYEIVELLGAAAASRTIGFSYPVTRSKVLLLSWGGPGL
ncbi:MAG: hypothetical protein ACXWLS_07820 [Myxococcaceae bacterium]